MMVRLRSPTGNSKIISIYTKIKKTELKFAAIHENQFE